MASYLITGASRGIGLELTKQLLDLPANQVGKLFAVSRSESSALTELANKHPGRIVHIAASVDSTDSVEAAAKEVKANLGTQGLDVLINNAGIGPYSPDGLKTVAPEKLTEVLDVNVVGPQRMISAFLPLLEAGKQKKVINISSSLGSIACASKYTPAPSHAYKVSKAALNMLNAQYALDHADDGFTFLCVSPGWLKTDLGGEGAELEVEVGVAEVKRIILESNKEQNGKFLNIHVPGMEEAWGQYDGKEIPW